MDFTESYSARFSMWSVDPTTWLDVREVMELEDLSIDADRGDAQMESASATVGEDPSYLLWVRIYLETTQGGEAERSPVFTGRVSAPKRELNGTESRWPLTIASVLSPCAMVYPDDGYSIGGDVPTEVKRLLSGYTPAPVSITSKPHVLSQTIVAEGDWTVLDLAQEALSCAEGLRIRISGDGTIGITDDTSPVSTLDTTIHDVVLPELTDTAERDKRPNVYRAVMDGVSAEWRDDVDVVERGVVMVRDADVILTDGETLAEYARRKGLEAQKVSRTIELSREFDPSIKVGDVVSIDLPGQGIQGLFRVESQSIDHSEGGLVDEEVSEIG